MGNGNIPSDYVPGTMILLSWIFYPFFPAAGPAAQSLFAGGFGLPATFTSSIVILVIVLTGFSLFIRERIRFKALMMRNKEQEERYRLITENSRDVIWTMDMEGRFTFVSPSVQKLLGYSSTELSGKPLGQTLTPSSRSIADGLFEHFREILLNDPGRIPSVVTEMEHITREGATVWSESSVTTIHGNNGNPSLFFGVSRDITERKKREVELRQSEENYRLLAETSLDFILVHDTEGYITYANSSVLNAVGYSIDELKGRQITDIISEEYHHVISEFLNQRAGGDKSRYLYEITLINRENRAIPVEVSSAPLMVRNQAMAELITARDISERQAAQKTLIENERRFRSYIEYSPVPVFILDTKGVILFVNDATARTLGYSVDELNGKFYADLKVPGEKENVPDQLTELKNNGRFDDETRFLHKDGSEIIAMVRGKLLEDNSFLVYAVDITERILVERKLRETDEKIRQLNAGLEEKVKKRTEELEQANRELEAFSFSVSHDLRAPLRHIEAFTHLIEQSPSIAKDPKLHRYFNNISLSVGKMNTLIDSLLTFSRTGRSPMVKAGTNMDHIVRMVLEEMEQDLEGRSVDIRLQPLGNAMVDPNLIRQVWYNLISNAVKFTRNEKNAIITIGKDKIEGKQTFFVQDNGAGFDPSYKSKLFGVFQRLHSETEFEGTGIGLANVKRIITRHGGKVWAESSVGQGAAFYFHLP